MSDIKKKRVGRPPIDTTLKAQDFKISMTLEQMKEIDEAAADEKMGRSEYFRVLHKLFTNQRKPLVQIDPSKVKPISFNPDSNE